MSKEEHTRREFLQTAGLGAAALAAGPGFAGRGDGAVWDLDSSFRQKRFHQPWTES
jgi:hypothetical protein